MTGDNAYTLVNSGSRATSAAGAHLLFGNYQGLSTLNNAEVVHISIWPGGCDIRVWNSTVTNDVGLLLAAAASLYDLPPMRAGDASLLHVARVTTANASPSWAVWRRLALNVT